MSLERRSCGWIVAFAIVALAALGPGARTAEATGQVPPAAEAKGPPPPVTSKPSPPPQPSRAWYPASFLGGVSVTFAMLMLPAISIAYLALRLQARKGALRDLF